MCSEHRESSAGSEFRPEGRGLKASSYYEETFTEQYEVLGLIGQGAFAQVILAHHLLTGTEVAVKVLPKLGQTLHLIDSELDILKSLDHPNVIQLFQVVETRERFYLVMELAGGGRLLQHIPVPSGMEEVQARRVFRQVASALCYCHSHGIVHRDLKPENILLDAAGNAKVCDFGLGDRFRPGQKLRKACGTFLYHPPELFRREGYDGPAVDVWSLGVTLCYMLTGRFPFKGKTYSQVKEQVLNLTYALPSHVSAEAQSLIGLLLSLDPAQRPTGEQILAHPWLSQGQEDSPRHPRAPLTTLLDHTILRTMFGMGFNFHDTLVSLEERKFDKGMATYLILKYQMTRGSHCTSLAEAAHPKVRTRPCPAPPLPQERAIEPVLSSAPFLPARPQLPQEDKQSGLTGGRGASLPAIALGSPKRMPPTAPWEALRPDPEPPTPSPCTSSQTLEPEGSKSWQGTPSEASSLSSGPPQQGSAARAPANAWGWSKVTRAIGKWLREHCWGTTPKTGPAFHSQVFPVKRAQERPRFFRWELSPKDTGRRRLNPTPRVLKS